MDSQELRPVVQSKQDLKSTAVSANRLTHVHAFPDPKESMQAVQRLLSKTKSLSRLTEMKHMRMMNGK